MRLLAPLRRTVSFGGSLTLPERLRWLRTFRAWKKGAFAETFPSVVPDTVAIVLSRNRPQNIDAIVRLLLRTPSVAKVIVSNDHMRYRMNDWLSVRDPRLTVIDQCLPRASHLRFALALREEGHTRFLAVDDDLFLKPSQLEALCSSLRADASRAHGVTGFVYDSWRGMTYHNMHNRSQRTDVVSRAYAFTSPHAEAFFRLAAEAGLTPAHDAWRRSYWSDLVLSYSAEKPEVVFAGPFLDCPSRTDLALSEDMQTGFFRYRLAVLLMLRRLRPGR